MVWSCPGELARGRRHQTGGHSRHSSSWALGQLCSLRINDFPCNYLKKCQPYQDKIMFYTKHIFFLTDCYSSILIMSTVVCSGSQGKMVAELGTKLRRTSFSFIKPSIRRGMQLPKSKWQGEFKGEATNWPVNPSIIFTNDTTSYCQRCGLLLDLVFQQICFPQREKSILCPWGRAVKSLISHWIQFLSFLSRLLQIQYLQK